MNTDKENAPESGRFAYAYHPASIMTDPMIL
jgi:hypothetical protein